MTTYVRWFRDIGLADVGLVGGTTAFSLNPDAVVRGLEAVAAAEARAGTEDIA